MYLAPECAIGEDEVDGGENDAENPSDKPYGLPILGGRCIRYRQAIDAIDTRQQHREYAKCRAGKHTYDEGTRGEESCEVILPHVAYDDANEPCHGHNGKNEAPGSSQEIRNNLRLHGKGRNGTCNCQHKRCYPRTPHDESRPHVERAFNFHSDIGCTVHGERGERHQPDEDGVPIQNTRTGTERIEVRPERLKEVAAFVQRDAANYIRHCRAIEEGEQGATDKEQAIPERRPDRIWHPTA
jgi:hypothetical protein